LQNYACDPTINVNQVGSDSYIGDHVIKEKIDRYHKDIPWFHPRMGMYGSLRFISQQKKPLGQLYFI
jgi:hypothetical protein